MRITTQAWETYIRRLAQLNEKAAQLMAEYLAAHGIADTEALTDYAAALVQKYGEGSAELACQMYDAMAALQNARVSPAEPAAPASRREVARMVQATRESPPQMQRGVSRLVKRAGADTTLKNAQRDGAEFAWVPHGDSCAFCLTLASRGWQRASQAAIKGGHAEHIHASCDCEYAVRFDGRTSVAGYDPEAYLAQYNAAGGDINRMRRVNYAKNKERINAQKRAAYIGDNKVHLSGTYNREVGGGSFGILDTKQKLLAGRNLKITGFTIEGTKQTYTLYGLRAKDETVIAMNAQFAKGDVIDMTVAIVVSKDTPTTYKPYIGQTTPLTLPETVYGGEVDAVSGEGQETWKSVSLDGTENWNTWGVNKNNATVTGFYTYDINDYSNDMGDRDKILCSTVLRTTGDIWGGKNVGIGFADSGCSKYLIYCMKTDTLSDTTNDKEAITSFKTFLADLYTAGTPVQVAYVLNEPVPFTATGAQPLIALAGANTVLTDADSATVTGRADPIKRITDLEAAVASIN